MLFEYFTRSEMKYVMPGVFSNGRLSQIKKYWHNGLLYTNAQKYPAVFDQEGVCATYSLAFEDIANRLGIPCRVVLGDTGMEHAWNVVYLNGEIKHIDIAFALMYRSNKNAYFLTDGFNRQYLCNYKKIFGSMRGQILGVATHIETSIEKMREDFWRNPSSESKESRIRIH